MIIVPILVQYQIPPMVAGAAGTSDFQILNAEHSQKYSIDRIVGVAITLTGSQAFVGTDPDVFLVGRTHILHIGSQLFFGAVDEYRQSAIGRRFLATEGGEST
jgi:hypothetical protein